MSASNSSSPKASQPSYTLGMANREIDAFTFTASTTGDSENTMSGYLDDDQHNVGSSSSSHARQRSIAPTSLFAHLAQRQFDQQQQGYHSHLTQAEYEEPSSWTTMFSQQPNRQRRNRNKSRNSSTSTSDNASEYSYSSSDADSLALQKEWEEQVEQMKLMFQIIIFPFVGKFFGRKFGYFLFNRYRTLGSPFSRAFWSGISN